MHACLHRQSLEGPATVGCIVSVVCIMCACSVFLEWTLCDYFSYSDLVTYHCPSEWISWEIGIAVFDGVHRWEVCMHCVHVE